MKFRTKIYRALLLMIASFTVYHQLTHNFQCLAPPSSLGSNGLAFTYFFVADMLLLLAVVWGVIYIAQYIHNWLGKIED